MQNNRPAQFQQCIHSVLDINNCYLYKIQKDLKTLISHGLLKIIELKANQTDQITLLSLKLNQFQNKITKIIFHYIEYTQSVSFFFEGPQNLIYCLAFLKEQPQIDKLQVILSDVAHLLKLQSDLADPTIKAKIIEIYPDVETQDIYPKGVIKSTVKTVGYGIGSIFATADIYFKETQKIAQEKYQQKMNNFGLSEGNQSRWDYIKQKAWNLNEKMTKLIKPIGDKTSEWSSAIGQKYRKTDNTVVKFVRDISKATATSLNDGYHSKKQHRQTQQKQLSQLPNQAIEATDIHLNPKPNKD